MQNKSNNTSLALTIITSLLVLLWTYTVCSKLANVAEFKQQLYNQTFSHSIADLLLWLIPIAEIMAVLLLIINKTRLIGLLLSFFLMLLFTGYIALVLAGVYDRVPCSCGGVLKYMGWKLHLWFNLFFWVLSAIGILLYKKLYKTKINQQTISS